MRDLHSALKTFVLNDIHEGGVRYKVIRLQYGKDDFQNTLHASPSAFTYGGIQTGDVFNFLGFKRSPCPFHEGECFVKEIPDIVDAQQFALSFNKAYRSFQDSSKHLETCGIYISCPESHSRSYRYRIAGASFDGHTAPQSKHLKEAEDDYFRFIFSFIHGGNEKGWTIHFRAKHMPLAQEFSDALDFLHGFREYGQCPEFEFDSCWWRFIPFEEDERDMFFDNSERALRQFDEYAMHFSPGLESLLVAHSELKIHGLSFLPLRKTAPDLSKTEPRMSSPDTASNRPGAGFAYDVAISYANSEKSIAEELAGKVRASGYSVFFDDFYPEQLWGKDLIVFFDNVYRKDSRYCVMFISKQYAERIWTTFERRSAQARALEEKGKEYILPIRVDKTDLDGLPPTIGYLNIGDYPVERIAEILIAKITNAKRDLKK